LQRKEQAVIAYEIKLLTLLGFAGSFKLCVKCGKKLALGAHVFDATRGIICNSCMKDVSFMSISFEEIKILSFLQDASFEQIDKLVLTEEKILSASSKILLLRRQHLEKTLKTEKQ